MMLSSFLLQMQDGIQVLPLHHIIRAIADRSMVEDFLVVMVGQEVKVAVPCVKVCLVDWVVVEARTM